ncbi:hydroxymethylglutaryl-CoA reductase, degradative [Candidatus Lokiarchaeum ossiferum]|uniref:hydroxymethylglutaryl-CoA reductase, degradative n=1 Tax=Candidatus Lokiarchaeum ossiferum TaxID=2951803 RepID=UPI00352F2428
MKSSISGFYKHTVEERQSIIKKLADLTDAEQNILKNFGYFNPDELDAYTENVIGSFQLPFSLATNFLINENEYLIPMVTEEPSIVAAASNAARFARKYGGFRCEPVKSIMIGQIQIVKIEEEQIIEISQFINFEKKKLLDLANSCDEKLISLGGGARDIIVRQIKTIKGPMVILHVLIDVLDAMGANAVNTMVEALANYLEDKIPGMIMLKIISNLSIHRMAKCSAIFDTEMLGGPEIVSNIMNAYAFAQADPFRATTHNKGIMNGISALALATGNDTRALEAGAHAFASYNSKTGSYSSLSKYWVDNQGRLCGELELPMPIATIGNIIQNHPMTRIAFKILQVSKAEELAQIAVAVGLAQNIAALRALASEGIQKGHMKLHNKKLGNKS